MQEVVGMLKRTQLVDYVELKVDDTTGIEEITWVVERQVNRALPSNLRALLDMIDRGAKHKVVVRSGNQDLTLIQFDRVGIPSTRSTIIAQSTFYNYQSELRRIEAMLQSLPEDSPQRVDYVSRADQLRQRMGITDDPIATEKSDEALRRLENIFAQEAFDKSLLIPDAELATYDLTKLTTLGVPKLTKQWDALITRWVKVKKEINNAEQSVVTNPDQAHS